MNKCEIIIFWSEHDNSFIAEIPELKGCIAHGETHDDALKQVKVVANEWMKIAKKEGWEIPQPKGRLMFA